MATTKKRIQITPSEEVYNQLKKLSDASGTPMSKFITEILDHVVPSLEIFAQIMDAAKKMSDEAPNAFIKDLEDSKQVLIGSLGYVDTKLDWGIRETGILGANPLAINKGVRSKKAKDNRSKSSHVFLAATSEAKKNEN